LAVAGTIAGCANPVATVEVSSNDSALPPVISEPSTSVSQIDDADAIGTVVATPQLNTGRAAHTATLLLDGGILIAGGFTGGERALASAELYDPASRSFSAISPMTVARQSHTATRMPDGRVLIAGGFDGAYLASAEIYDPATGLFTPTAPMATARSGHIAVLLNNGKILLAGGTGEGWTFLAGAELYDPTSGLFSTIADMTMPRESHTATLLKNGEVLITGGHRGRGADITIYDGAELYDPSSEDFRATGSMAVKRHKHDATLLPDGRVFVSGGSDERDSEGAYHSTEIYDPATGKFSPAGMMIAARYKHTGTSIALQNGLVVLVGGATHAETFDENDRTFHPLPGWTGVERLFATSTLLSDGGILFVGGYGPDISAAKDAWLLSF
jgi:hypothetical protein